jgi:Tfp pilus assembly protein PilO
MRVLIILIIIAVAFYFWNKNKPLDRIALIDWMHTNVKVSDKWKQMEVHELQALYACFIQMQMHVKPSQQVTDNVEKILTKYGISLS